MIEVRVPDEQEGTKAVVRAWLKRVGDPVAVHDPLVELETEPFEEGLPARFRLFAQTQGAYPLVLIDENRRIGTLQIR